MAMIFIETFCKEVALILGFEEKELSTHLECNLFGPPFYQSAEEMLYLYTILQKKYTIKNVFYTNETTYFTSVRQMHSCIN